MHGLGGILCFCLLLFSCFKDSTQQAKFGPNEPASHNFDARKGGVRMKRLLYDIVADTDRRIKALSPLRVKVGYQNPQYEIGYLNFILIDKYRKMVDRYNHSVSFGRRLWLMEHVLNLKEIQHLYFDIHHFVGMLHEIERKYKIVEPLDKLFTTTTLPSDATTTTTSSKPDGTSKPAGLGGKKKKRTTPSNMKGWLLYLQNQTRKKKSTRWWWPLEYGWEIDYWWG